MISNKAQQILNRVKLHLKPKQTNLAQADTVAKDKPVNKQNLNQDKTDPLFPNSADSGSEPKLPITGPEQGMLSTRFR